MVANLRAENIDGFLGPDPFNQRAVYDGVGFIYLLSKELWEGHPCCAFAASKEFVGGSPNTYAALLKAIINATAYAAKAENRKEIAAAIAPANYLNQPQIVLEQILTGTYADGLGNIKTDPKRIDFDPFPWESFAVLDPHADETLGADQERRRLPSRRPSGLSRHRHGKTHAGGRTDTPLHDHEDFRRHGQAVRSGKA
jgi:ABC-type nitrate/sulfonate/bicarbonate transport system substrate-binding protein